MTESVLFGLLEREPDGTLSAARVGLHERLPRSTLVPLTMYTAMLAAVGSVTFGVEGALGLLGAFYGGYLCAVPLDPVERGGDA